jgi:hypothetical protein
MRRHLPLAFTVLAVLSTPTRTHAQYAEVPRPLPAPIAEGLGPFGSGGAYTAAAQVGSRLFVAGPFTHLSTPAGGAVVATVLGATVPNGFPHFGGSVQRIVLDGLGGWLVAGDFTSVNGQPATGFARVASDRSVDPRFRVVADGAIHRLALAHGRVYLAGEFTTVNGAARRGLAALDAATGQLTSWAAGFDGGGLVRELATSSVAVYAAGGADNGHVWGLDAGSGRVLFDRRVFVSALAASSDRVYLGGEGAARPVWAVDAQTGTDLDWAPGLTFVYIPATYGWDGTHVSALLLDGGRLYIGGRFRTADGRFTLTAVNASDGVAVNWRPAAPQPVPFGAVALYRIGPVIAASFGGTLHAFDVGSAATVPFQPDILGGVATIAPAPEGVVLGGSFVGSGGIPRAGLAAIDLATYDVEPWTAATPFPPTAAISTLATDGTWLFAQTEGTLNGPDARIVKIDPVTGAVAGELTFPSVQTRIRVAGGQLLVATLPRNALNSDLGVITIADWSYTALPVTLTGRLESLDAAGDTIYMAGRFTAVNGQPRRALAAVHRVTGAVLPWQPAPNDDGGIVRTSAGRVWVAGVFSRLGGQRRRGLAEVDPVTGAPLAWNPDVAGVLNGGARFGGVAGFEVGADGHLYASLGPIFLADSSARGVAAGQLTPLTVAYSTATGGRLPWRPTAAGLIAVTPDCLLVVGGCLQAAVPAPTNLQVTLADNVVTLTWTLAATPSRSGVRLEAGTVEGRADLIAIDLPADRTSFAAAVPAGRYFARVRALAGPATSLTTPDVSFAVGPPDVPGAPLDLTARTDGPQVTFAWQPPSTGAPPLYSLEAGTARGRRDIGALAVSGAATSLTLTLPVGTYWTRLVAVDPAGRSAPSADALVDLVPRQVCSASPPQNLAASVVNRVVTLTWDPPADGNEDPPRIVAGTVPGGRDVGFITVPPWLTSFSIAAPPGVYYVHLEVGCFTIATSNEVQVAVP